MSKDIGTRLKRLAGRIEDLATLPMVRQRQKQRDAAFPTSLRLTEGQMPLTQKIAILVLFQPQGLARSALATCRHLARQGYATLAINNAPLYEPDRATLAEEVWRVIERPNWGYDFGAYRDGLRLIRRWGVDPDRLLILNDSVWFPLASVDTLIARTEALSRPFAGACYEEKPGRAHGAHLQSYFFLLDRTLLRDPAHGDFWAQYPASDRRGNVLRLGEKGYSAAMRDHGYTPAFSASRLGLIDHVAAAPDEDIEAWLDLAAPWRPEVAHLRDASPSVRREAMLTDLTHGHFLEAYIGATASAFGMSFLKKRHDASGHAARGQFLDAVNRGMLPLPDANTLEEIEKSVHHASL